MKVAMRNLGIGDTVCLCQKCWGPQEHTQGGWDFKAGHKMSAVNTGLGQMWEWEVQS